MSTFMLKSSLDPTDDVSADEINLPKMKPNFSPQQRRIYDVANEPEQKLIISRMINISEMLEENK